MGDANYQRQLREQERQRLLWEQQQQASPTSPTSFPTKSQDKTMSDNTFNLPSPEERRREISQTVEDVRARLEKDRAAGKQQAAELFGPGQLGRLPSPQTISSDLGVLRTSAEQAQQIATGLSDRERQLLLEQGERGIHKGFLTSLRTLRGISSQTGKRGETSAAREAELLREQMRLRRDLEEGIILEDLQRRERGTALGIQAGSEIGKITTAVGAEQARLAMETGQFNLGRQLEERQRALQTELAQVGLGAAIESGGAGRALAALQQDVAIEFGKRSMELEQKAIDKPAPEAPSGGLTVICTLMKEKGLLPLKDYRPELWAVKGLVDPTTLAGYHFWAVPFVKFLRRSPRLHYLTSRLVRCWVKEMNRLAGLKTGFSPIGWFLFSMGRPVCRLIGYIRAKFG